MKKFIPTYICNIILFTGLNCLAEWKIPDGGVSVCNKNIVTNHKFYHNNKSASLDISTKNNQTLFTVETYKKDHLFYSVQLVFPSTQAVKKNDIILISFKARCLTSDKNGIGVFQVYFQKNKRNWHKAISEEARAENQWRTYYYPFKADINLKNNESELCFGFGLHKQKIELKDIKILNYKQSVKITDFPSNNLPLNFYAYKGMEANAPWRAEAAKRIDKIRKANITVSVTHDNKIVKGAEVSIKMKRHAFLFGSAINMRLLRRNDYDGKMYRKKFLELFNSGGPENSLKWLPLAGEWGSDWAFNKTKQGLEWLKQRNIKTRGHVIIWPSWKHTPKFLKQYKDNPQKLTSEINKHIYDITKKCEPYIYEWDVINEPYTNNDIMKVLGDKIITDWFVTTHKSIPKADLYLNDYNILTKPHGEHYQFVKDTIEKLLKNKAPINGLGIQSHFSNYLNPPEEVLKTLNELSKYNLKLKITEFDVKNSNQELIANYTRDFMTIIFSHPAIHGFQMWGFCSKAHWRPEAAMYNDDWSEKSNLKVYKKLLFNDWWSNANGVTDANGTFNSRAFLGDYEITVKYNNKLKTITTKLGKDNLTLNVKFK